ncbi:MAG: amidohydrolase [Bacteroidota bacterium]|nr:amidohydrolase [Bacteroidota bacterium]
MKNLQIVVILLVAFVSVPSLTYAQVAPAPDRGPDEGEGPFERLIIRGATVIDGTGSPPRSPMDIVIEGNRIVRVTSVGAPHVDINENRRPGEATFEIDAHGKYVMPGIVDLHAHTGGIPKTPEAEYIYKLWLAHGITTVRGVSFGGFEWSLNEKQRSAKNLIAAPHMVSYHRPGSGWDQGPVTTPEAARAWVRFASESGVDGIKLGSYPPDIMSALLDEAAKHNLGSTAHLGQMGVAQMNALDAARLGLGSMTHFYGLFEALYDAHDVQPWPVDMDYNDEQLRFGQVARQWSLVTPNSDQWHAVMNEFLELDYYINPTLNIYSAGRDVMRAKNADWHEKYTLGSLWEFFTPSRTDHGSYFFNWTTHDEVAWKRFYQVWMQFLNEYKNLGGKVTVGSDSGYIYQLFGFGTILELELLQEAGFHPLEVVRAATMHGAMEIYKPLQKPIDFGIIRAGMRADLLIVDENPLANLKVLYGTGAMKLNDETGEVEYVGGVKYTIKDGILYDAKALLEDIANMVEEQRSTEPE